MKKFKTVLLGLALAAMATTQVWGEGIFDWWNPYEWLGPRGSTNGYNENIHLVPLEYALSEWQHPEHWYDLTNSFSGQITIEGGLAQSGDNYLFIGLDTHHTVWKRVARPRNTLSWWWDFFLMLPEYIADKPDLLYHLHWTYVRVDENQNIISTEERSKAVRFPRFMGALDECAWTLTDDNEAGTINVNPYFDWWNPAPVDEWPNPLRDSSGNYLDSGSHSDVSFSIFRRNLGAQETRFASEDARTNYTPRTVVTLLKSNSGSYAPVSFKDITQTEINSESCSATLDVPAGTNRLAIVVDDLGLMAEPTATYSVTIPAGKCFFLGKSVCNWSGLNSSIGYPLSGSLVNDQITVYDEAGNAATLTITNAYSNKVLMFNTNLLVSWPTKYSVLYKNNHANPIELTINGSVVFGTVTNALSSGWNPLCWLYPETKTFGSMNFPVQDYMTLAKWDVANSHWDQYSYDPDNNGWDVDPSNLSFVPGEGFLVQMQSATNWVMNLPQVVSTNQLKSIEITVPSGYSLPDLGVTVTCVNGLTHTIPTVAAGMKFHICTGDEVAFEYSDEVTEGMNVCQLKLTDCFGHKSSASTAKAGYDGYTHTLYTFDHGYSSSATEWSDWSMDAQPERSN